MFASLRNKFFNYRMCSLRFDIEENIIIETFASLRYPCHESDMAVNRFFRRFCINRFGMGPLQYQSSRSDFGFEFSEIFVRRPSTERKQWGDQEWHLTSIIYKILYVCSVHVKINKKSGSMPSSLDIRNRKTTPRIGESTRLPRVTIFFLQTFRLINFDSKLQLAYFLPNWSFKGMA